MNKYAKWYTAITNNAKQRISENYTERYHTVPNSLGGIDSHDNLVNFTARSISYANLLEVNYRDC